MIMLPIVDSATMTSSKIGSQGWRGQGKEGWWRRRREREQGRAYPPMGGTPLNLRFTSPQGAIVSSHISSQKSMAIDLHSNPLSGVWLLRDNFLKSCFSIFVPPYKISNRNLSCKMVFWGWGTKFYRLIRPLWLLSKYSLFYPKIHCSPYLIPKSLLYNEGKAWRRMFLWSVFAAIVSWFIINFTALMNTFGDGNVFSAGRLSTRWFWRIGNC